MLAALWLLAACTGPTSESGSQAQPLGAGPATKVAQTDAEAWVEIEKMLGGPGKIERRGTSVEFDGPIHPSSVRALLREFEQAATTRLVITSGVALWIPVASSAWRSIAEGWMWPYEGIAPQAAQTMCLRLQGERRSKPAPR